MQSEGDGSYSIAKLFLHDNLIQGLLGTGLGRCG